MTSENSIRVERLKFICAVMVVAIHCEWPAGDPWSLTWLAKQLLWNKGITLIAVPFFFLCSGYFLAKHLNSWADWRTAVRKRVRTLLVPFVVWSLVFALVVAFQNAHSLSELWTGLKRLNLCPVFGLNFGTPMNGPLWYVRNLFFLVLTAPAISYGVRRFGSKWLLACFCASVLFWAIPTGLVKTAFLWFYSLKGLFFFSVGVYLRVREDEGLSPKWGGGQFVLCATVGTALLLLTLCFAQNSWRGCGALRHALLTLVIPMMLYIAWRLTSARRLPRFLEDMSFPIYLMHNSLFFASDAFLGLFVGDVSAVPRTQAIVRLFFGVFGAVFLAHLLRRLFPRLARIAFGGR